MLLADMGAHVTRIERPGPKDSEMEAAHTILKRERDTVADLIRGSDIVFEGFRPPGSSRSSGSTRRSSTGV